MKKRNLIISWILRVLVALGFIAASLGKLTKNQEVIKMFENWGFPEGFYFIIGVLELVLALIMLFPKTLKISLIGISMILIGATVTHLINDPIKELIRPFVFIGLISGIYYLNFNKKVQDKI